MRKLILLLATLSLCASASAQTNRFGIVEGFWLPDDVCELGVGWERIIFNWEQHQPTGPTDWHTLNVDDRWLKAANQCGREVVGLLKHTPAWATTGIPGAGVPTGLHLPVDDPDNHWANFVRQSARYYASRGVNRFIIWNEPDITSDTYGFEFEGDLDDYFQMLRVAYLAAKQGNPAAEIHIAGTTYWHDVNAGRRLYLDRLLERISEDEEAVQNGYYFDAVSLHIYFRTDSVYDIITETRDLLESYQLGDKAIWLNETNAPPTQDPEWPVERPVFQYTLEQQSAFVVQAAALSMAAGAERIAVYKFFDQDLPPGGETFGLLRPDQTRRPAFDAWRTVTTQFANVESAELVRNDDVDVVLMQQPTAQVVVAWSRTGEDVTIEIAAEEYTLPGALCNGDDPALPCPVGGEPVVVIADKAPITVQVLDGTMPGTLIDNGEVIR